MTMNLCNTTYYRPLVLDPSQEPLKCQYIRNHPSTRHSFYAIEMSDKIEVAELEAQASDETPMGLREMLDQINNGDLDSYLEAILAAGHARKRALRGVRLPYGVTR